MKRKRHFIFSLFLCSAAIISSPLNAQTPDDEKLLNAQHAFDVQGNCNDAIKWLNQVSAAGRSLAMYLQYAGKVSDDCNRNKDQALVFYDQYLALVPNDQDILRRRQNILNARAFAERQAKEQEEARAQAIRNQERQQELNEQRRQQEIADEAARQQHMKELQFGDLAMLAIGYGAFPVTKSFANNAVSAELSLISGRKWLFEYSVRLTKGLSTNKTWFTDVFNQSPSAVQGIGSGGNYVGGDISFMPFIGGKKFGVAIGPVVGAGGIFLPTIDSDLSTSYDYNAPSFTGVYGGQLYIFMGNKVALKAKYTTLFPNAKVTGTINNANAGTVPLTYDLLAVYLSFRLSAVH